MKIRINHFFVRGNLECFDIFFGFILEFGTPVLGYRKEKLKSFSKEEIFNCST